MKTDLLGLDGPGVWDTERAFHRLQEMGVTDSKRTTERRLHTMKLIAQELTPGQLRDDAGQQPTLTVLQSQIEIARASRHLVLFSQLQQTVNGDWMLHANDARGARYWTTLGTDPGVPQVGHALMALQMHAGKPIAVFPHGDLVAVARQVPSSPNIHISLLAYPCAPGASLPPAQTPVLSAPSPHLKRLEAESIFILREALAESENPVMLYSMGKDSSVMLHLARKAFFPGAVPFPLLHVDTRWKFRDMYQFRDEIARTAGVQLLTFINQDAIDKDINPFDHGSALHTQITKTEGLKKALDQYQFDMVFGGARRDEEKSRAKERIFSFRSATHGWNPKSQRPELWSLYNTRKNMGESIRVFPLSNWTELDIWQYILQEAIPVVPLYFAKERPVVERNCMLLTVDDNRFRLLPGEQIRARKVRFRTLGCYPLTAAVESEATSVADIILELIHVRSSERQGRAIDSDASASMEKKKQEGYF